MVNNSSTNIGSNDLSNEVVDDRIPQNPEEQPQLRRSARMRNIPSRLQDYYCHSLSAASLAPSLSPPATVFLLNRQHGKDSEAAMEVGNGRSDDLSEEMEVQYVGSLCVDVDPIEQDDVASYLLEKFQCVPTFLPPNLMEKYYEGFCKKHLMQLKANIKQRSPLP
nr:probable alpha,alpha-trehalose-phosphate synthase [UDP-forming] 7 [Ipomoea batatas]